jgi:XTP/dITP diphosphohydrolase
VLDGKLVIASHNEGKVAEIRDLLAPYEIEVVSAAQLGIAEPEETGVTFAENAELKARHCAEASHLPALADDSGLVIPTLGGQPGVYSARWAGPGKDFNVAFARIQRELPASEQNPAAYFACALCLAFPGGKAHHFEGRVDGRLTFPPRGRAGFGYDPVFIPDGHAITFGEMDLEEKQKISHRARAFAGFAHFLKAYA